jgi:hypothetical protein
VHFRSDRVRTTHPRPGERHLLTAPAPSKAIRGVLEKFADLPHEVEAEIRGLDEARRPIAELERQNRKAKDSNSPPLLDQLAIQRAVRVAVERERTAWQQKLERGRARFRQMSAAVASAGRAFDKLKVMLDEIESERASVSKRSATPNVSRNHRPVYPIEHRATSADSFDEPRRLPSGERRILTALAQYPESRSKAQVAVLAGYALNGGGFNNCLGALRSRGVIKMLKNDVPLSKLGGSSSRPNNIAACLSIGDPNHRFFLPFLLSASLNAR